MNNHFEFEKSAESSKTVESSDAAMSELQGETSIASCCSGLQRDRFELLSAYLDGEVTASERRQVEEWLATDAKTQCLYSRLLALRQGLQGLPIARSEQSVEQLVNQVTAKLDRQPRRWLWGGIAAALFAGALINTLSQERYVPSLADSSGSSQEVPSEGLMIALNHPPIEIPAEIPGSQKPTPGKAH